MEYILSPEFVQLVEEHPYYFLALTGFGLFAWLFLFVGLSLCIQALPRPSRATYHYHWPAQDNAEADDLAPEKEAPWAASAAKRWEESTRKPIPDPSRLHAYTRVPIPKDVRFRILRRDKFRCQLCGCSPADGSLHVDHKMPVAAGGTNADENLWTLCESCNLAKSDKIMEELFEDFLGRGIATNGSVATDTLTPDEREDEEVGDRVQ